MLTALIRYRPRRSSACTATSRRAPRSVRRTRSNARATARKPRCVACNNCALACPFGVPKMKTEFQLMMKCDMCYDRTSAGKKPMCATVCPSGALFFGARAQVEQLRPHSSPVNQFRFGNQVITTKVNMMAPKVARAEYVDVTAAMDEEVIGKSIFLNILSIVEEG